MPESLKHLRVWRRRGQRGQSLVEFTILLPVILIMLSGLIEFGFLLNSYLDLIDAAREAARFAANDDPIHDDYTGALVDPNPEFYYRAQELTKQSLFTSSDARVGWPARAASGDPIDCSGINGDIVVSSFATLGSTVNKRYPVGAVPATVGVTVPGPGVSMCGSYFSKLTTAEVNTILSGSGIPNTGFVLVEIYYEYDQLMNLPWIQAFVPDPVVLYAYSIMPNVNVEPTPTP